MKTKLLLFALLLMGVSAGAQTPIPVSIFDDCTQNGKSGIVEPMQMVDLGLSVKWANKNVGAAYPGDYGDYFAWGEVTPKSDYSSSTYLWEDGRGKLTKYCTNSQYGTVDNKTTLELADDAAHVNWGGAWRMPTDAEWTELRTQCTWTWTQLNGVNGYRVSASNGNSIFLPAAGYRYHTSLDYTSSRGYYWSSSLDESFLYAAWTLDFYSGGVSSYYYDGDRYYGRSVRPVCP